MQLKGGTFILLLEACSLPHPCDCVSRCFFALNIYKYKEIFCKLWFCLLLITRAFHCLYNHINESQSKIQILMKQRGTMRANQVWGEFDLLLEQDSKTHLSSHIGDTCKQRLLISGRVNAICSAIHYKLRYSYKVGYKIDSEFIQINVLQNFI